MEISSILSGTQSSSLASLLAGSQQSKQDSDLASSILSEKDSDGDGSLTADELGMSESQFAQFDTDGDGLVSQAELEAGLTAQREKMMAQMDSQMEQNAFMGMLQGQMSQDGEGPEAQMASDLVDTYDTDGDGALSAEELGFSDSELAAYDTDGDGLLSTDELQTGLEADHEAMMAEGDSALATQILADLDSDSDGSLSLSEVGEDSVLASFDTDGDGLISSDELITGLAEQRQSMMAEMGSSTSETEETETTTASSDSTTSSSSSGGTSSSSATDEMDTNMDGTVSYDEYLTWMEKHGGTGLTDSTSSQSGSSSSLLDKAIAAYQSQSDSLLSSLFGAEQFLSQDSSLLATA